AEANLRKLLAIPEGYSILFLQGGARLQFSMAPMNLLADGVADYVVTGSWGKKALEEARRVGEVHVAWDGKDTNYDRLPTTDELSLTGGAKYVHVTSNETIQGVQFPSEIDTHGVPLVSDCSSDLLYRPIEVARHGLIYACAQKNVGPAGVTIVIVRDNLLAEPPPSMPGMLSYYNHAQEQSRYNTPPVFGVYMVKLVTDWLLRELGSLDAMHAQNQSKAGLVYDVVDQSNGFYDGHAQAGCRSLMNVTFRLPSDELQTKFLAEAESRKLCNLKGHRSVGGIRASIYNAMPPAGCERLADFMDEFCRANS
ncbi:MAG: 3-phosphoserine/phosphohydroxythreonine transaminase, partial [Pirellulales bacterium]|nr:3-phosphoserine/phosphohydroxythreonine transaminase [Pirellulales bacterium]